MNVEGVGHDRARRLGGESSAPKGLPNPVTEFGMFGIHRHIARAADERPFACHGKHNAFLALSNTIQPSADRRFAIGVRKHAGHACNIDIAGEQPRRTRVSMIERPQIQPLRSDLHGNASVQIKTRPQMTGALNLVKFDSAAPYEAASGFTET